MIRNLILASILTAPLTSLASDYINDDLEYAKYLSKLEAEEFNKKSKLYINDDLEYAKYLSKLEAEEFNKKSKLYINDDLEYAKYLSKLEAEEAELQKALRASAELTKEQNKKSSENLSPERTVKPLSKEVISRLEEKVAHHYHGHPLILKSFLDENQEFHGLLYMKDVVTGDCFPIQQDSYYFNRNTGEGRDFSSEPDYKIRFDLSLDEETGVIFADFEDGKGKIKRVFYEFKNGWITEDSETILKEAAPEQNNGIDKHSSFSFDSGDTFADVSLDSSSSRNLSVSSVSDLVRIPLREEVPIYTPIFGLGFKVELDGKVDQIRTQDYDYADSEALLEKLKPLKDKAIELGIIGKDGQAVEGVEKNSGADRFFNEAIAIITSIKTQFKLNKGMMSALEEDLKSVLNVDLETTRKYLNFEIEDATSIRIPNALTDYYAVMVDLDQKLSVEYQRRIARLELAVKILEIQGFDQEQAIADISWLASVHSDKLLNKLEQHFSKTPPSAELEEFNEQDLVKQKLKAYRVFVAGDDDDAADDEIELDSDDDHSISESKSDLKSNSKKEVDYTVSGMEHVRNTIDSIQQKLVKLDLITINSDDEIVKTGAVPGSLADRFIDALSELKMLDLYTEVVGMALDDPDTAANMERLINLGNSLIKSLESKATWMKKTEAKVFSGKVDSSEVVSSLDWSRDFSPLTNLEKFYDNLLRSVLSGEPEPEQRSQKDLIKDITADFEKFNESRALKKVVKTEEPKEEDVLKTDKVDPNSAYANLLKIARAQLEEDDDSSDDGDWGDEND